jgi:glutaredoxin
MAYLALNWLLIGEKAPVLLAPFLSLHSVFSMKINAYLKPSCGWSNGVRAIMQKYNLQFVDIDIINNRANYAEMVQKSGQPLSPCVEVDGVMLADVSGEEVENYLLSNELVKANEARVDTVTNAGCSDAEHAKMASKTVRFF